MHPDLQRLNPNQQSSRNSESVSYRIYLLTQTMKKLYQFLKAKRAVKNPEI
jgi:hypothetical protein